MGQVSLSVNGSIYRMACEDGEEQHVTQLGARFDEAIDELRSAVGPIGDQRLLVMAGILMTDRLDDAERRLRQAEDELRHARDTQQHSSARVDGAEKRFVERLEAAAERIERLVRRLQSPPR